jgi:HSP20 family molecular chaperone IbpA
MAYEKFARDYINNMENILNRNLPLGYTGGWSSFNKNDILETGENAEMTTENNKPSFKYTFTFPGIGPERVSVRLRPNRSMIDVYVDNKLQRTLTPRATLGAALPSETETLKEENVKVSMEHGLLTIIVSPSPKNALADSIELPINGKAGKQFLNEDIPNELI